MDTCYRAVCFKLCRPRFSSTPFCHSSLGRIFSLSLFINSAELSWFFWISMGLITVVLLLADIFTGSIAVRKFGGSKWGERVAAVSIIIGSFIYPPFGIIIVPFIAVFIAEVWVKDTAANAFKAAIGTLIGFLSGQFAEAVLQIIMIIWFFLTIWI